MYTVKYARRLNASEAIDFRFFPFLLGRTSKNRALFSASGARDRSSKNKRDEVVSIQPRAELRLQSRREVPSLEISRIIYTEGARKFSLIEI